MFVDVRKVGAVDERRLMQGWNGRDQAIKDPLKTKGLRLSMQLSIAGRRSAAGPLLLC